MREPQIEDGRQDTALTLFLFPRYAQDESPLALDIPMLRTIYVLQKILITAAIFFCGLSIHAQDLQLEVKSFVMEENSLTAKNEPVYDNNQQKCALVIISGMGDETLSFNFGNSFNKVEEKSINGERVYLMWIPEGVVKVSISSKSNPKKFEAVEYFFNPRVKKAETYLMQVELTKVASAIGKQYLEFVLEPSNAYIEVNGEPWTVTDGIAYRQLAKGTYSYHIQAKDYHSESGVVDFKDLSTKKTVEIKLKPNYGWLTISSPIQDITVFVDDEIVSGNLNRMKLSSGIHSVRATKEMYLPYTQSIEIKDGQETPFYIELEPNFSQVKLIASNNAEIFLDDKFLSQGSWNGNLAAGSYKAEVKKEGYRTYTEIITVLKVGETYEFKFKSLDPIYGSANFESNPPRANVTIDGKDFGKTPLFIPQLLIGSHKVVISLSGYQSKEETISIREGQQSDFSYTLSKETPTPTNPNVTSPTSPIVTTPTMPTSPRQNNGGNHSQPGKKRYGCIDINAVLKVMPQYIALQQEISRMTNRYESEYQKLSDDLKARLDRYQNSKRKSSKEADEISQMQERVDQFKKTAEDDLKRYQETEMSKLNKTVSQAINQVATAEKLELVVPIGVPLYIGKDVIDITKLVQNKLK